MWEGHSADLQMDDSKDFVLRSDKDKCGDGAHYSNWTNWAEPHRRFNVVLIKREGTEAFSSITSLRSCGSDEKR